MAFSPEVPQAPVPAPEAGALERMGAERAAVIDGTRGALGGLAQVVLPVAIGAGVLSVMYKGLKTMFRPLFRTEE